MRELRDNYTLAGVPTNFYSRPGVYKNKTC